MKWKKDEILEVEVEVDHEYEVSVYIVQIIDEKRCIVLGSWKDSENKWDYKTFCSDDQTFATKWLDSPKILVSHGVPDEI
jgi:hypothetical protein